MITLDALARELGCTLADLNASDISGESTVDDALADALRAHWTEKTGIDYTETVK